MLRKMKINHSFQSFSQEPDEDCGWGTDRAVGPIEDPAGEVSSVPDDPRHVLRQICVEVWSWWPETEASIASFSTVFPEFFPLVSSMVDISNSVVRRSYQTFWRYESVNTNRICLKDFLQSHFQIQWKLLVWKTGSSSEVNELNTESKSYTLLKWQFTTNGKSLPSISIRKQSCLALWWLIFKFWHSPA